MARRQDRKTGFRENGMGRFIRRAGVALVAAGVVAVAGCSGAKGAASSSVAFDEQNPDLAPFYTGDILPTPRQVDYQDLFFDLGDTGLLLGPGFPADGAHARELRGRIELYGGAVKIVDRFDAPCRTLIILGDAPAAARFLKGRAVPDKEQAYVMACSVADGKNVAVLKGHDNQGALWAISSFNQLVRRQDGRAEVRAADIVDFPEQKKRGLIALVGDERYARFCLAFKINAPVFQAQLRDRTTDTPREKLNWRAPLTEETARSLRILGETLTPFGIRWYAGENPFHTDNDLRSCDEKDYQVILGWARAVAKEGGNICLKYDDLRFPLVPEDMKRFGSARETDFYLLNRLSRELSAEYPKTEILVCPPFYWGPDGQANYPEPRDAYLYKMGELPANVAFFWTGPRVKSSTVTPEQVKWFRDRVRRVPVYWQNCYGMPHFHRYHFFTDPVTVFTEWYYPGFFKDVDGYMLNGPTFSSAVACVDFCWNPDAYDPRKSIADAAKKLVGPDTYPLMVRLNEALSRFDRYGNLNVTPGAAKNSETIKKDLAEVNAIWEQLRDRPAVIAWTGMSPRVAQVNRFYEQLKRNSKLKIFAEAAEEEKKRARADLPGFDDKEDRFLSAYDFLGGSGPNYYSMKCEKRLMTTIYGSRSPHPRAAASFEIDPFPPDTDYELTVSGQDDDADAKCRIRIKVNATTIFEGENPFVRHGWSRHAFRIPSAALLRNNALVIENIEDTCGSGNPPFFVLNYAVLKKVPFAAETKK